MKKGYVVSKTRSLGQILGKPCEHSRGHNFSSIFMKLCQNVCLYGSKTRSLGSNLRKTLCTQLSFYFALNLHETLSECLSS